ncbi:hypothetical protein NKH86_31030, partial [Mesorhizobium sp. M0913]|uniref:hypothetical protein n=1 Tax=Mesorhizobium sp. M0913 TaxID=2957026 RepID=UPI00333782C1
MALTRIGLAMTTRPTKDDNNRTIALVLPVASMSSSGLSFVANCNSGWVRDRSSPNPGFCLSPRCSAGAGGMIRLRTVNAGQTKQVDLGKPPYGHAKSSQLFFDARHRDRVGEEALEAQ